VAILWYLLRWVPTRMDASLLRMVTRDSDVRELLAARDRAALDKSRPVFEAAGLCKKRLDLFSGIS
jgi:hypothetical protein